MLQSMAFSSTAQRHSNLLPLARCSNFVFSFAFQTSELFLLRLATSLAAIYSSTVLSGENYVKNRECSQKRTLRSIDGVISPQSNVDFDRSLRQRNAEWGYRDTGFLQSLASANDLSFMRRHVMPANNHILVYAKQ